jgi:hypothetical protein
MLALFSFCRVSSYRLGDLVAIFASLYLSSNRAEDDDLLGDAYEDLMRHFATESGKSKGLTDPIPFTLAFVVRSLNCRVSTD